MSRDWLAIYVAVLGKTKYRRLSPAARGALFHVWMLAAGQSPEATWPSVDELRELLELDGFPVEVIDELLARHWLDVDRQGRCVVHDWDEHQLSATLAIKREYERDRKAEWRRSSSPSPTTPSTPTSTRTSTETGQSPALSRDVPRSPGHVRDSLANATAPVLAAWEEATGRSLIGSGNFAIERIDDACRRHPEHAVIAAIVDARAAFAHVPATEVLAADVRKRLDPFTATTPTKAAGGGHTRSAKEAEGAFHGS